MSEEPKDKSDDLLPCPFCGNHIVGIKHGKLVDFVTCPMCGADGPSAGNKEKAKQLWNERQ